MREEAEPSQNEHAKPRSTEETDADKEERRKMHQELHSLMKKYEEMAKKMGASLSVDQLLTSTDLPYNAEVMAAPLPPKFKVTQMEMYDGSKDPLEHLETFKAYMTLHGFPREVAYKAFPLKLKGEARGWFGALPPGSIDDFG